MTSCDRTLARGIEPAARRRNTRAIPEPRRGTRRRNRPGYPVHRAEPAQFRQVGDQAAALRLGRGSVGPGHGGCRWKTGCYWSRRTGPAPTSHCVSSPLFRNSKSAAKAAIGNTTTITNGGHPSTGLVMTRRRPQRTKRSVTDAVGQGCRTRYLRGRPTQPTIDRPGRCQHALRHGPPAEPPRRPGHQA